MREAIVLVVLVLSAPFLAGCISTAPAADVESASLVRGVTDLVHELGAIVEARVPVQGAALHGTVYLPDVAEGEKVPVILDLGPYYGNLNSETSTYNAEHPPNALYEHFLRRGYAIALMSARGTGQSSGCFMIGGPQERADAAAAVEWLAAQPWSNGAVAMTGVSYDGTTPWEALVSGAAPSLKAIIPVESISDFYRYSFYEGVPIGGGAAFNTYYLAQVDVPYGQAEMTAAVGRATRGGAPSLPPGLAAWATAQPSNLCPQQVEVYTTPYQTYRDGVHGPYWDARDMSAMLADATAPVFVVHGFKDFNVKMDHVQTLWGQLPPGSRMLLGQWAHNIPWRNSYDKEQSWHEYNATMDSFLDAYLRGDPTALAEQAAAPRILVQDSANLTRTFDAWPPTEAALVAFRPAADGTLAEADPGDGTVKLRASPANTLASFLPVGTRTPQGEATFDTGALTEDLLLVGNPVLRLTVTVDRPEGALEAGLYEVDASGKWELVSSGWQNLATRESRDKASDVPTGTPLEVRIPLLALAQRIEAGNHLVLVVSADPGGTLTPKQQVTTFTLKLGGAEGAALELPVLAP